MKAPAVPLPHGTVTCVDPCLSPRPPVPVGRCHQGGKGSRALLWASGWSPHWPGCLSRTSRSGGAGRVRGRGWKKVAGRARCPRGCLASGGRTEPQPQPAPAPGQRGRAHRLGAGNAVRPAPLSQRSADPPTALCSASRQVSAPYPTTVGVTLNFYHQISIF